MSPPRKSNNPAGRSLKNPEAGKRVARTYKISPKTDSKLRRHAKARGLSQSEVIDLAVGLL